MGSLFKRLFFEFNSDTLKLGDDMPADFKITTDLLYKGALFFALMDAVYILLLMRLVSEDSFRRLTWALVISAALIWWGIWSWAISSFWETVYSYVFPPWAQAWTPWIAFAGAGAVAFGLWLLTVQLNRQLVLTFCLLGGVLGSLTHIWAVYRGIVIKPPMLQGASPLGAVVIAFFEYIFYWCTILLLAKIIDWARMALKNT
jgi:hypothetical protein